jgi:CRISPR-associated protein Csb1
MDFEHLLKTNGPVALTIREYLEPVQGKGSVLFPATFAPPMGKDEPPSYVISGTEGNKVALIDTVGAQANRIEPLFEKEEYRQLVPAVSVKVGERKISILEAGHRAADAVFRFSDKAEVLDLAFAAIRDRGDCSALAKIAPTSIVFGAWDSRGTRVKLPRIVGSVIRAYEVEQLDRSAQFFGALEKEETDAIELEMEGKARQDFLSNQGLSDSPAGRGAGGVRAKGGVVREATLNLIVLRSLKAGDKAETDKLQKYILGLALLSFYAPAEMSLREGCLLVRSTEKPSTVERVYRDGKREDATASEETVLDFAKKAAAEFGVGEGFEATFEQGRVKKAKEQAEAKKEKKKGSK